MTLSRPTALETAARSGTCARCRAGTPHRAGARRCAGRQNTIDPRIGPQCAGNHVEQRGLAGTVGADDREDLAWLDVEAHVADGEQAAKALADVRNRQQRAHRAFLQTELARQPGPDAVRHQHHHQQQADAVEHLLGARHVDPGAGQDSGQRLGEAGEQECPEDRSEQRADAADDRPQDDLDRAPDVEHLLGKQVVVVEREEHAGERCHCRPRSRPRSSCSGRCRCRAPAPPPRPRGSPARNSRAGCATGSGRARTPATVSARIT